MKRKRFPRRRAVIFVYGCFWHSHDCALGNRIPRTHTDYWIAKIDRNHDRDIRHVAALHAVGGRVATVWECQLRLPALMQRMKRFLDN